MNTPCVLIIGAVAFVLILFAASLVYDKYISNFFKKIVYQDLKKAVKLGKEKLVVSLYYAEWCGVCKNFKPMWEKLKQQYANVKNVIFREIDCSKKEVADKIRQLTALKNGEKIDGYPTVTTQSGSLEEEKMPNWDIGDISKKIENYLSRN